MKKSTIVAVLFAAFALISSNMNAQVNPSEEVLKNLKPYPETIDSLQRYVIFLDEKPDEALYEVEIIGGKNMDVDCNRHSLIGRFQEDVVQGWGYNYYVYETDGNVMSTMMMCMEPKTRQFVSSEGMTVRYNSKLPLVVYMPKGYELKYRIWTAGELESAKEQ